MWLNGVVIFQRHLQRHFELPSSESAGQSDHQCMCAFMIRKVTKGMGWRASISLLLASLSIYVLYVSDSWQQKGAWAVWRG